MIMKRLFLSLLVTSLFFAAGCSSGEQPDSSTPEGYPNAHLLTSAAELSDLLASGDEILLVDARGEIDGQVIPGAVHFPAVSSLIDQDHPIEFYMVGPDRFQELMQTIGLNEDSKVVIYDEGNALAAARLFYGMDYYGFSNASVLNGGIQAWNENNGELTDSPVSPAEGSFQVSVQEALMCDFDYVTAASQADDKIIFDARSIEEYTGTDERATQSGHVPNAVHLEWNSVLEPEGIPYFLPAETIQEKYSELGITPDKEVIPHCHTNVRGSHAYFTLRLMGYDSVRPYEGSWSDYGNREGASVAQ
jgi:thiosulfate/3-mercaptopyruvate sulfurtransferase